MMGMSLALCLAQLYGALEITVKIGFVAYTVLECELEMCTHREPLFIDYMREQCSRHSDTAQLLPVSPCTCVTGMWLFYGEDNNGSTAFPSPLLSSQVTVPKAACLDHRALYSYRALCLGKSKSLTNANSLILEHPWDIGRLQRLSHFGGRKMSCC